MARIHRGHGIETHLSRLQSKVRLHIAPALGKTRLRDLTKDHLQKLYRRKRSDGLSPRSVRYIHVTMTKALHDAHGADLVRKNVASFAKPPKDVHDEKPVMSVADAMLFLEKIRGDRFEALYLLAVITGLRRGEMLDSFWCEIEERTTVGIDSPLASVMVRLELTEPPPFGLWYPGWP